MDMTPRMAAALLFVAGRRRRRERLAEAVTGRWSNQKLSLELGKLEE
jgi:hypothetical protein